LLVLKRFLLAMTGGEPSRNSLLPNRCPMPQNYTYVIPRGGDGGASLHPLARTGPVSRVRSGSLLSREGWVLPRSQAHLRGLPRSDRVPELRAPSRRAIRRVGRDERTGTATPETHGVLTG